MNGTTKAMGMLVAAVTVVMGSVGGLLNKMQGDRLDATNTRINEVRDGAEKAAALVEASAKQRADDLQKRLDTTATTLAESAKQRADDLQKRLDGLEQRERENLSAGMK